ncbi:hypothetical protein [Mucilaginibacter sp. L3T2-6]|uniref:hypothetical protein n=1 Tax=Mucilaginibacter sp. L3T2-6 TaxID=3062491 RepID=UPI002676A33A|nr:hypothetical protein [Mucilaginibacter sp. L3T2-6]MDO3642405.1 hypothetical protein [Mucilaginibacter sp. L3T2-6]MDV6214900.1 hypothetical protein [Mucilaginibacter sp. L3T2-6]
MRWTIFCYIYLTNPINLHTLKQISGAKRKPAFHKPIKSVFILFIVAAALIFVNRASAQTTTTTGIGKLTGAIDSFINKAAVEKLYIQFDRASYAIGDTIWFKAYLLNASGLAPSLKSGILYAELANDSNKVVQRIMLPVSHGLSWGDIAIDPKTFREGGYTLRAYTNWMRNFGETSIFKQQFYFSDPNIKKWLINSRFDLVKSENIEKAKLRLQFNQLNNEPVILKDLQLSVLHDGKILYSSKSRTKLDGTADVDFTLKYPVKNFSIMAQETDNINDKHSVIIPVNINRPEKIDLQFMPESGPLIAGVPSHIGFKAINEDGEAADVEGRIFDSKQHEVTKFKSAHMGIGAFDFEPVAGEVYTARIDSPVNTSTLYKLPTVLLTGTMLKINAMPGQDSLVVIVAGANAKGSYYLVGQTNSGVCYSAIINLSGDGVRFKIPTTPFPSGIARFTLFSDAREPLNQRLVFINHNDFLKFRANPDNITYLPGDSINFQIEVTDNKGQPVTSDFSVAVTDDSLVKIDTVTRPNIVSTLLLTSDLKGTIEEPGYYFQADAGGRIAQHLDNLMLTQGWVNYDWKDVFGKQVPPLFPAETDFVIRGRVTNVFNKPVANSQVLLFSKKTRLLIDRLTDKDGRFEIRDIIPLDTPVYVMQARNKRGKSFNVSLSVDEFKPPAFASSGQTSVPWYVNSTNKTLDIMKKTIAAKTARDTFKGNGHILKEVKITAKKFIKDSQNPNGPGNADVVIDEKELEKAGRKTFLDLLLERVPGFREGFFLLVGSQFSKKVQDDDAMYRYITDGIGPTANTDWYFVNDQPVKIIVDGVSLYKIYDVDDISPFMSIKDYLTSHSAEDIKGIEVSHSAKYGLKYFSMEYGMTVNPWDIAYVEITTRSGNGPYIPFTPGTYLYKPMPFSLPRQFYQPKYRVHNNDGAAGDNSATIFWKPNMVTDNKGQTTVDFHAPYKPGVYTLIVEGTDMNGHLGVYSRKIKVSAK